MYARTQRNLTLAGLAIATCPALGGPELHIVATSGVATPYGDIAALGAVTVNNNGKVGFGGNIGVGDNAVFIGDHTGFSVVEHFGDAIPDGDGTIKSISYLGIDADDAVVFWASMHGASLGADNDTAIVRSDGVARDVVIRERDDAPNASGVADGYFVNFQFASVFADAQGVGPFAFSADLRGTSGGTSDRLGVFSVDDGAVVQAYRRGDPSPDGSGTMGFPFTRSLYADDDGRVVFQADVGGDDAIFIGGDGAPSIAARVGDGAPMGGVWTSVASPHMSDAGWVTFVGGRFDGVSSIGCQTMPPDTAVPSEVVKTGDAYPPAGPDAVWVSIESPRVNDAGDVAFIGTLAGQIGGATGIFRVDPLGVITEIVREGDAPPDANGVFHSLAGLAAPQINEGGDVLFYGSLTHTSGGGSDDAGLYFFREAEGLSKIVREGDPLDGGTVTGLAWDWFHEGAKEGNINALAQVAARVALDGGWSGGGRDAVILYSHDGAPDACVPDIDGDGTIDTDDFFAFLALYAASDAGADINDDGDIDTDDFFAFLAAYAAGC